MKKILAAIAACAMSAAMLGMTVCAAGVESEEDSLDDEDTSTDITLDDTDDTDDINDVDDSEEPADDTTDDAEEPSTDTVDTTTNPGTGNSPIALAVIPVALAAAAVVAKKAK